MPTAGEDYERYWARRPYSSRGPLEGRREYHGAPHRDIQELHVAAERAGLGLELSVKAGAPRGRGDSKHRLLHRLIVRQGDEPVVIVDVQRAGGLAQAAALASEQLRRL